MTLGQVGPVPEHGGGETLDPLLVVAENPAAIRSFDDSQVVDLDIRELRDLAVRFYEEQVERGRARDTEAVTPSDDDIEKLRALGYLEG